VFLCSLSVSTGLLAEEPELVFEPSPSASVPDTSERETPLPTGVDFAALLKTGKKEIEVDVFSDWYFPNQLRLSGIEPEQWRFEVRTRGGWYWTPEAKMFEIPSLLDTWKPLQPLKVDETGRLDLPEQPEERPNEGVIPQITVERFIQELSKTYPEQADYARAVLKDGGEDKLREQMSHYHFLECELWIFEVGEEGGKSNEPSAKILWKIILGC